MPRIRHLLANIYTYIYIDIDITLSISDMDFLYQFNLSLHHFWGLFFSMLKKKYIFQKLAGLWLVGKVVYHVGLYGSKVAEGCSAFQRRSCILYYKKIKMDHKRTPYPIDTLKSVKILSAFNASGDVKVFILTHASFHLPGGLIPCDIMTSFAYC